MVDGTGLENQRGKPPQVRILSLPPKNSEELAFQNIFVGRRCRIHILPLSLAKKTRFGFPLSLLDNNSRFDRRKSKSVWPRVRRMAFSYD